MKNALIEALEKIAKGRFVGNAKLGDPHVRWSGAEAAHIAIEALKANREIVRPDREAVARILEGHTHGGIRQLYERGIANEVIASCVGTECRCGAAFSGSDEQEVRALWSAHVASLLPAEPVQEMREAFTRIDRAQYPEIIQAARWSDEDSGTNHFEPGIGFVIDDPDGLNVPRRWMEHVPVIEEALRGLDHTQPHPLDVDTLEYLEREGKEASLTDSAAYCFVCGEHTPMTAMAQSSRELWIASRFLNEYFEGWVFDPCSGFALLPSYDGAREERERLGNEIVTLGQKVFELRAGNATLALEIERLLKVLKRAAVDMALTPRHNREGRADEHIKESRERIRAALAEPEERGEGK